MAYIQQQKTFKVMSSWYFQTVMLSILPGHPYSMTSFQCTDGTRSSILSDSAQKLEAVFDGKWKGLPLSVPESKATLPPVRPFRVSDRIPLGAPLPKAKRTSGASSVPARSKGQSTTQRNPSKKRPVPTSITEDQLFALCEVLSNLSDRKMDQVIALIRRRMPQYRDVRWLLGLMR